MALLHATGYDALSIAVHIWAAIELRLREICDHEARLERLEEAATARIVITENENLRLRAENSRLRRLIGRDP